MPISRANKPGTPCSAATLAITIIESTATAPTERSMPAVRMISVCPTARAATTAVCCTSSDSVCGLENRAFSRLKTITVSTRIMAGLIAGCACSRC